MTDYLSANDIADLLGRPRPTPEQAAIIEADLSSMLVVAGAGSGKTETMSARVVWLIANGHVEPQQVLGLTFTRKAAGELLERVRVRLMQLAKAQGKDQSADAFDALNRPTISTYNSYAASLVQEHGLRIGREPGARLLSEASQWAIVTDIVERWQGEIHTDSAVSTLVGAVLGLAGALNEHMLSVDEAKKQLLELELPLEDLPFGPRRKTQNKNVLQLGKSLSTRRELLDLVNDYNEYKRTTESMDFGDQVALAAQLAETVPLVGELERERFKVVLLDEYQDTSYAQIRFLSALYGKGHPVTAVGDPNQSIYAWRGASAAGPARFPEQFRTADGSRAVIHKLGTSWRNDVAILDAANTTSAPLFAADPQNSLPSLEPRPGAGLGRVDAAYYSTIEDEAQAIAAYLKENWRAGQSTAAVLCRKRSQFPLLESTLRAHGIPVEVVGLGGLLSTPEVVDLVSFLEAVHDPSRGDSIMRILTGPRVNLGAADLIALGAYARKLSRAAALASKPRAAASAASDESGGADSPVSVEIAIDPFDQRSILDAITELPDEAAAADEGFTSAGWTRLKEVSQLLDSVRGLTYLSVPELVEVAEKTLGLDIEMALAAERSRREGAPFDPSNPFGRAHLDALHKVAVNFADTALLPTLGAFLAWLDDAVARERGLDRPVGKADPNAVQLITVHASKGLEWDVVVVPGLSDGQFPSPAELGSEGPKDSAWLTDLSALPYPMRGDCADLPQLDYSGVADGVEAGELLDSFRAIAGEHQVMEERRLAYVAFTRARQVLFLTGAWWRTAVKPSQASKFMQELVAAGVARLLEMAPVPEAGDSNPRDGEETVAVWPFEGTPQFRNDGSLEGPHGAVPGVDSAAERLQRDLVKRTIAVTRRAAHLVAQAPSDPEALATPILSPTGLDLADLADLLLAERDAALQISDEVEFPAHISVSGIVEIDKDRDAYARARRRPIPREPSVASRRGTTFHLWVEKHFGATTLFDLDDVPGADDDLIEADDTLDKLMRTFERSQWAGMQPIALERDIDIVIAGTVIRARIDAVFADPENPGGAIVVDWKTGRAPQDASEAASRELQLALYRIAWSQLTGLALEDVSAAFYYVANDKTVRPQTLATREEIEQIMLSGRP